MNLNANIIQDIINLQSSLGVVNNKLLTFALAFSTGKATVLKTIQQELSFSKEEVDSYIDILNAKNYLTKKDFETIGRVENTKIVTKEDHTELITEVINHLNLITKSRRKVTDTRIKILTPWIKRGFKLEHFVMVNLFFFSRWSNDPELSEYLRPETLYNSKFQARVDDSNIAFEKIHNHSDSIADIIKFYMTTFNQHITQDNSFSVDKVRDIEVFEFQNFELQKKIAFWLSKNISIENIKIAIEETIVSWSQKEELIPRINLLKILDNKFPERLSISLNKRNNSAAIASNNSGVTSVADWLENK